MISCDPLPSANVSHPEVLKDAQEAAGDEKERLLGFVRAFIEMLMKTI